jgi:hypothetical protein
MLLSWWGLPGTGIGGTQSGGVELGINQSGYRYATGLNGLSKLPILTSGTKSLLGRWTASTEPLLEAQLADADGLVNGFIVNRAGRALRNVRLFYNGWGYRLGTIADGGRIDVGTQLSPRRVKTIVTQNAIGSTGAAEQTVFTAERAPLEGILNLMMFYDAAGGSGFAELPNRCQPYCDLSRLLSLGRAIIVADAQTPGSRLVDAKSDKPFDDGKSMVVYRFVLPVVKE